MSGLKQRLAAGELVIGTFLKTPAPMLVEVLSQSGLDCLCIDAEHAPFDRLSIDGCLQVGCAIGLPMLVRVPANVPEHLLNALDCGAEGVLVPHVRSREEADAAVRTAHFGAGGRGYAGSTRAAAFGLNPMAAHLVTSAERTVVIAQIEDVEALDAIDEIAATPGLDALFIGRIDLTVALRALSPDDPAVISAIERVMTAARTAAIPVGMFVPRDADVPDWRGKGATLFLQGSDQAFARAAATAMVAASRGS